MILIEIGFAIVATLLCILLVVVTVGWDAYATGGWPTAILVFSLLFLTIWTGAVWLTPVGMKLWGAEWIPFLVVAFIVGLFVAAFGRSRQRHQAAAERADAEQVAVTTMNVFFWVLIAVMLAALVIHYGQLVVEAPAERSGSWTGNDLNRP